MKTIIALALIGVLSVMYTGGVFAGDPQKPDVSVEPGLNEFNHTTQMFTFCAFDPDTAAHLPQLKQINAPCIVIDKATVRALSQLCVVTYDDTHFTAILCSDDSQ